MSTGCDYKPAFPVLFDDAIARLEQAGFTTEKVGFLYGGLTVFSKDRAYSTTAGRWGFPDNISEEECKVYPLSNVWFFKCRGETALGRWRFLRSIGDALGSELMTEFHEALIDAGWSVAYGIGLTDDEVEQALDEVYGEDG
jgi:hypothetical protein